MRNLINNEFVPSSAEKYYSVVNPATGKEVASVPFSTSDDVAKAVSAAQEAFKKWNDITIKQRTAVMLRFHALVEKHSDELADIIIRENGKNRTEALADVAKANETVEWACSLPQLACGKILEVSRGITCSETRVPLGVVGCIVPFNFPCMVPMWTIPIALTVGNCVICKPSEKVPTGMQRMAELMIEAGMPSGVFQIVHGSVDVVNALCENPDISAVTFVGSSRVAEIVSTKCHRLNKRVLALGGAKNHLVALPDCDIGMTSRDVVVSYAGCCGQRCMAASVLLIVGSESENGDDVLLSEVIRMSAALKPGQGNGEVGPIIDAVARDR